MNEFALNLKKNDTTNDACFLVIRLIIISHVQLMKFCPGRGGHTEVTPDHTIFERTHVPGALNLDGLELVWSEVTSLWDGWAEAVLSAH